MRHLVRAWDDMRWANEPGVRAPPTGVASVVQLGDNPRMLAVTLKNNRFCFCKGASHKSNAVYLVVDRDAGCFYQKCHDKGDCGPYFRSPPWPIPPDLCAAAAPVDAGLSEAIAEAFAIMASEGEAVCPSPPVSRPAPMASCGAPARQQALGHASLQPSRSPPPQIGTPTAKRDTPQLGQRSGLPQVARQDLKIQSQRCVPKPDAKRRRVDWGVSPA
mmetsp:Transcript_45499/g.131288  ORF Transcript_45499/g.131288 Transcript_45499/m.131288 type:complete len:217 (-) Transcript_45499:46-696(-)